MSKRRKFSEHRTIRAGNFCESYRIIQGGGYENESDASIITDILSDLMHLAASHGEDFSKLLTTAQTNFEAEK